jgi:hypothetical protein
MRYTAYTLITGLLLGASYLGNACAGSRLWCIAGGASPVVGGGTLPDLYQLRGYFCRTKGIFSSLSVLSLPFDIVDTALGCQGILTATEREVSHHYYHYILHSYTFSNLMLILQSEKRYCVAVDTLLTSTV